MRLAALFAAALACAAQAAEWPRVAPRVVLLTIDARAPFGQQDISILDERGRPVYRLRCVHGSQEALDAYARRTHDEDNSVPDFTCDLAEARPGGQRLLLLEDESAGWYSRGHFAYNDLLGPCRSYPEFGRVRHFLVRGLRLTLEAKDFVMQDRRPVMLHLAAEAAPDATATRPYTLRPGWTAPRGNDCAHPAKGYEPRMCRNGLTLSWEAGAEQDGPLPPQDAMPR